MGLRIRSWYIGEASGTVSLILPLINLWVGGGSFPPYILMVSTAFTTKEGSKGEEKVPKRGGPGYRGGQEFGYCTGWASDVRNFFPNTVIE